MIRRWCDGAWVPRNWYRGLGPGVPRGWYRGPRRTDESGIDSVMCRVTVVGYDDDLGIDTNNTLLSPLKMF